MRLLLLGSIVLLPMLGCGDAPGRASEAPYSAALLAPGTPAPDITLRDLDGQAFPLSSLRGKTVLLSFWFRKCTTCQAEMPRLSQLTAELAQQRQDVEFLAVNFSDTPATIRAWWKDNDFKLRPVMQREGDVSAAFGVQAYPTNYVIGPDGKVVWAGVDYEPAMIRGALASTLPR